MENLYDTMLAKMNLSYFNGNLYKKEIVSKEVNIPKIPQPEQSYIYNKYFKTEKPEPVKPKTKEEYIAFVRNKAFERRKWQLEQMEKRKLLISATNGNSVKINASNSLFRLKTKF
jgi:hypothetical protein